MNDEGNTMPRQQHRHRQDENMPLVLLDTRLDDALISRAQSKQYSTLPSPFSSGPGAERWRGGRINKDATSISTPPQIHHTHLQAPRSLNVLRRSSAVLHGTLAHGPRTKRASIRPNALPTSDQRPASSICGAMPRTLRRPLNTSLHVSTRVCGAAARSYRPT